MKLKWIVFFAAAAVLAVVFCCLPSGRGVNPNSSTPFITISSVCVPEIPATAADLVAEAAAPERIHIGRDVLRAVTAVAKPGVLPYVVSAICQRNPETAGSTVAAAIALQPEDALVFVRAALCAASGQVERVVFAASRAAPALSANVAVIACQVLPGASDSIRSGLVSARPDLELYLEETEMKIGTNNYENVIRQSVRSFEDAARSRAK
jgi:hypothetical protein